MFGGMAPGMPKQGGAPAQTEELEEQGELGWAEEYYANNPIVDSKPLTKLEKLHRYCALGDVAAVRELITEKKLGTEKGAVGNVAMHFAAQGGSWEVVEHLAGAGFDVNTQNVNGDTPLHQAAAKSHVRVVQVLLKFKADRNIENKDGKCAPELARTDEMKEALPEYDQAAASNMIIMATDDLDDDDDDW